MYICNIYIIIYICILSRCISLLLCIAETVLATTSIMALTVNAVDNLGNVCRPLIQQLAASYRHKRPWKIYTFMIYSTIFEIGYIVYYSSIYDLIRIMIGMIYAVTDT